MSVARAMSVFDELTTKKLGVAADSIKALEGQIGHFYHLAAVYDLGPMRRVRLPCMLKARAIRLSWPKRLTLPIFIT